MRARATPRRVTPTAAELAAYWQRLLLSPQSGPGVCVTCFNLTDGYPCCYACAHGRGVLDAVVPISYSVAHEPLHRALFGYKRMPDQLARRYQVDLAAILAHYVGRHEECLARAAGTPAFELVTTVPSGDRHRDGAHPLREIATAALGPTSHRYRRLLRRSAFESGERDHDFQKYLAVELLDGEGVLLIDDTWTTGANAQSAAAALKAAGAGPVAALAIGRHVNREWRDNDQRLRALAGRFDWNRCPLCDRGALGPGAGPGLGHGLRDPFPPGFSVAR